MKMKNICRYLIFGLCFSCACKKNELEFYAKNNPKFDFKTFYNNKLVAHGMYTNCKDRVTSRFIMTSEPLKSEKIDENKEKYYYKQSIKYIETNEKKDMISYAIFDKNNPTNLIYKDDMMVAEGSYETSGNFARINYDIKINHKNGKNIIVSAKDRAFMIDENNILNKIKIKKFGINVGEITMSIKKVDNLTFTKYL